MKKRGDIWISAVLYMALGIVVLTIVLAAGLPVIQKMKDRQTLVQTKEIMNVLDQNIRTVYNEGPSSKRTVDVKIGRGKFEIFNKDDSDNPNTIHWEMETKALLSEPGVTIKEGNLDITTENPIIKGDYHIILELSYTEIDLVYEEAQTIISGSEKLSILNTGTDPTSQKIRIQISKSQ